MPAYSTTANGYNNLWNKATLQTDDLGRLAAVSTRILKNQNRYRTVASVIGHLELWPLIAAIHNLESDGDFSTQLAQGDPLNRVSTHVPKGLGPYGSWEEAAEDILRIKGWDKITDWPIARQLYQAEAYNGFGYFSRGVNSPYIWAATSLQQRGKYVADGVWDGNEWSTQLGVAAILKDLLPRIKVDPPVVDENALWWDKFSDVIEQLTVLLKNRPLK